MGPGTARGRACRAPRSSAPPFRASRDRRTPRGQRSRLVERSVEHGMAAPGIKDVATRAGVSVGTVSNVLNRPDVGQRAHPAAGAGRHRRRSGSCATSRPGSCATARSRTLGLRRARPAQPVLHRRRPGRGGRGPRGRARALPLQQRGGRGPRGRVPRHPARAAGAGRAHHAGGQRADAAAHACRDRGVPVVLVDRARRRPDRVVQRRGRRRRGRRPRRRPTCSSWGTPRIGVRRRPDSIAQVADRHRRRAARAASAPGVDADALVVLETAALDRRRGPAGGRSASSGLPAAPPADRRRSAPTTCSPSASCRR